MYLHSHTLTHIYIYALQGGVAAIAAALARHNVQALIVIGGFEAYTSVLELQDARTGLCIFVHTLFVHICARTSSSISKRTRPCIRWSHARALGGAFMTHSFVPLMPASVEPCPVSVCLRICLPCWVSVCLAVWLSSRCPFACLAICLSIMSASLSVHLFFNVTLHVKLHPSGDLDSPRQGTEE